MLEATIAIQVVLGKTGEAAIVAVLLVFNAAISFVEEGKASKALALLRSRLTTRARVLRDGSWQLVPAVRWSPAILATIGVLMTPVSPLLIAELLIAVAIYFLILDQFKVLIFRRFNIR